MLVETSVLLLIYSSSVNPTDFPRKALRCRLAIAITVNFVNYHDVEEAHVEEISGVASIFNQPYFAQISKKLGIELENLVYYKDETHYFVMTIKKKSLLAKGILIKVCSAWVVILLLIHSFKSAHVNLMEVLELRDYL